MRLAILGGGGFRVPLIYSALLAPERAGLIDELVLHDSSAERLDVIRAVLAGIGSPEGGPGRPALRCNGPTLRFVTDLDAAVHDADFVFSAIRVGGLAGRVDDENVALRLGVLGQETTGPGGIAYGLRTVPVALDIAERVARLAPHAYVVNFTNPAGMITEAMQRVLGSRVIGICDTPSGLVRRISAVLGAGPGTVSIDYVGLNHLGWLRGVTHTGRDLVADLLADDAALDRIEEGRVFGADWLRTLGAIPNEYLYYYYFTREAVRSILAQGHTRGEFLREQQSAFYARVRREPQAAAALWREVRDEREATYMTEARAEGDERPDLSGGGYEREALDLMQAIATDRAGTMILNVANGSVLPGLPPQAVIEVPCQVDGAGAHALPVSPPSGDQIGLMQQMKAVEQLTIDAAVQARPELAFKALALHPLVDSVTVARQLLAGYRQGTPSLFSNPRTD
jgi:6-phospho-beta-glucosidase